MISEVQSIYNGVDTVNYGAVKSVLKKFMEERNISITSLSKKSGLAYGVVKRYYCDEITSYSSDVLSKLCFCLKCELSDILEYSLLIEQ